MPRLITAIDDTVEVEYGQFVLQENPMTRSPLTLDVPTGPWTAVGGPGSLLLHSAATDHYPAIRIELWNDTPPTDDGHNSWDQILELTCDVNAQTRLQSVTATPGEHTLTLEQSCSHHARVHVGNQRDTAELGEGSFETGIERWLIQLWPA